MDVVRSETLYDIDNRDDGEIELNLDEQCLANADLGVLLENEWRVREVC